MRIRHFTMEDYPRVRTLWQVCHLLLGEHDSREQIERKLERDPDLFLVAEENQAILGVVMGTWDGRCGWVWSQAVDPVCRRTGIGRRLMDELERRLREKGALEIMLFVDRDSLEAQDFYEASGFGFRRQSVVMAKSLVERTPES